jgi:hypothetical protein
VHAPDEAPEVAELWRWRGGVALRDPRAARRRVQRGHRRAARPAARRRARDAGDRRAARRSRGCRSATRATATSIPRSSSPPATPTSQRADAACHELFDLALRLGGTVTGEHGIGWLKRGQLERNSGHRLRPAPADQAGLRPEGPAEPRQEALTNRWDSLGALRERQFRLLFTGQLISLLGDSFTSIALAFAVLDLTGSATDLGYVFAARVIPLVTFLLVGGVFADRLPRRLVMLTADVTRMGAQGAVAVLVLTHNAHVWELVVLQAIAGTASAFFNPASTGLTPMTISPERLQQANALRGISMASTGLVGFAIGGVVVTVVGPGWALAVDAASFGVSAFFLAQLRLPAQVKLPAQSFITDLHDGWREFSSRTWVWVIVLAASIGNMMHDLQLALGDVAPAPRVDAREAALRAPPSTPYCMVVSRSSVVAKRIVCVSFVRSPRSSNSSVCRWFWNVCTSRSGGSTSRNSPSTTP